MIPRKLFSEEHESFRASFRKFLEKEVIPHHEAWEERGYVDREVWLKAGENGFLCPSMPEQYGGSGADRLYSMVMMEETGEGAHRGSASRCTRRSSRPTSCKYGSEEQKANYLPRMARGEIIGAIAMSEPGVGSDLQSVKTTRGQGRRGLLHRQRRQDLHHQRLERRPGDRRWPRPTRRSAPRAPAWSLVERGMPGFEQAASG